MFLLNLLAIILTYKKLQLDTPLWGLKTLTLSLPPFKFLEAGLIIRTERLTGENQSFDTCVGNSHRPENSRDSEAT